MGASVHAESPVSAEGGSRFVVTLRHWPTGADGADGAGDGRWAASGIGAVVTAGSNTRTRAR